MRKTLSIIFKMLAFGFGIGYVVCKQYPNLNPVIIFFPLLIVGIFLELLTIPR